MSKNNQAESNRILFEDADPLLAQTAAYMATHDHELRGYEFLDLVAQCGSFMTIATTFRAILSFYDDLTEWISEKIAKTLFVGRNNDNTLYTKTSPDFLLGIILGLIEAATVLDERARVAKLHEVLPETLAQIVLCSNPLMEKASKAFAVDPECKLAFSAAIRLYVAGKKELRKEREAQIREFLEKVSTKYHDRGCTSLTSIGETIVREVVIASLGLLPAIELCDIIVSRQQ
jgi:hypothetical protein